MVPFARAEYEAQSGNIVKEVGFAKHSAHAWVGASADGLIGKGGIVIRSRTTAASTLPPSAKACRNIICRKLKA